MESVTSFMDGSDLFVKESLFTSIITEDVFKYLKELFVAVVLLKLRVCRIFAEEPNFNEENLIFACKKFRKTMQFYMHSIDETMRALRKQCEVEEPAIGVR